MNIIFDIGGTNMRVAAGDKKGALKPAVLPTPQDFNRAIKQFAGMAKKITKGKRINFCVGGVPGPLNGQKTEASNAPNLPRWNNKPFAKAIAKALKCRVILENDASLAGLGEAIFGAGRNKKIVAYLIVGTGVGGARIVKGKIDENIYGFEPGHQIVAENKGKPRTLESLIGGKSLKKRYGKIATEITSRVVWEKELKYLAFGVNNLIVHWSPNVVVLGGVLIKKTKQLKVSEIFAEIKKINKIFPKLPEIKKSQLGDSAGLYGALAILKKLR